MVVIYMSNLHPDVLKRYAEGKCTAPERQLVEAWLENDDDFSTNNVQQSDLITKELIWKGLIKQSEKSVKTRKLRYGAVALIAASLIIVFGIWIFKEKPYNEVMQQPLALKTFEAPKGRTATLTLNDGTTVQLSGGSVFKFPQAFSEKTREVTLVSGEAFFKVKHIKEQPFILHTSETQIKVLGTRFNVLNIKGSKLLAVTLTQGSISFKGKNQPETILKPGQQLMFDKILNQTKKLEQVDTTYTTSWTDGVLWFKQSSFAEVVEKLEAHYGVTFKVEGNPNLNIPLTGKFKRQPLSRILKLIENSSELKFKQEQNTIIIYTVK